MPQRFAQILFTVDALLFLLLGLLFLFSEQVDVSFLTNSSAPTSSSVATSLLTSALGTSLLFFVLPLIYVSVSPAATVPSLLYSTLTYGVFTVYVFGYRSSIIHFQWCVALTTCSVLTFLHFLTFSLAMFQKANSHLQFKPPNHTLRRPLLSSASHLTTEETKTSALSAASAATVSIALDNLTTADAAEEEQRQRRGYGTLQLLNIARPHRHWLYYACGVLLVRLPLSLSMPHWVAETITSLIAQDYAGAQRNIVYLCIAGTGDALLDFWCVYLKCVYVLCCVFVAACCMFCAHSILFFYLCVCRIEK